mgnify:CR=1 FL=1
MAFHVPISKDLPTSIDGNDMWVFAYASLMWRPDFEHTEICDATVHGFNRSLCIYSYQYRGTPECPGLVFGLDQGGSCRGRVLKVAAENVDTVMAYLYEREMINNVYVPQMVPVTITTEQGTTHEAKSLAFITDRSHKQYCGPISDEEAVKLIRQGFGLGGACIDYLISTAEHLRNLDIIDHDLEKLIKLAQ